jgi:lipoic acid synthetase
MECGCNSGKKKKRTRPRKFPEWLTKKLPVGGGKEVRQLLDDLNLNTVCNSARCPNAGECYSKGRATFLIMGPNCTRRCRFCAVDKQPPVPLDKDEPVRVAKAIKRLELKHAVITSVTRDDLSDGGAAHFVNVIDETRKLIDCTIEVLTPDFQGVEKDIACVADADPDIFNHNVETVERLYSEVRPEADYRQSLDVIKFLADNYPDMITKSGLMVGLGETHDELRKAFEDLRNAGCKVLTIGQYLAPTDRHYPVKEFIHPDEFDKMREDALQIGFDFVAAAPFVRSSYNAEDALRALRNV